MSKPTLVLLHGVGLDHTMWEPAAVLLSDHFTVLTPDLPGHGTRPPARDGITLAELADDIAATVPPGAHLVGFSLGALVAQHLAIHHPGRAATLTSVSSVCRRTPQERAAVLARLRTAENDVGASAAASLERWYAGTGVGPERVARTEAVLRANDPGSFLACYRVFATADAELAPSLGEITLPALAVTGEDDPGSTPAMTHRLAAALPDCRAVIVPRARHMLPVQRPRAFADALTHFIGERAHV
ncbi:MULTISPECIES: alpha/beta fold hydrolase [unclassified Streptomyces]|uniref:alpha/beta fold hydrolase n=1 Tax=unclassified Streptomyces TaxID=2593676 RepID=UPI001907458F|nr:MULTISPECIES: alpha/beta fold hydrolase [unclassified Streptomyces]MCU4748963.1 alpha/beta fold hydrolase [Streptomyces sp. G-5]QQN80398.1 alpha/beta fold hydrolase [Streptomyces sp. XC 2026]